MPVPMTESTMIARRISTRVALNNRFRHAIISCVAARETEFSAAIEDYAKAIYALQERGGGAVATTALAERLGVTAASASGMIRKLDEQGLVSHVPYKGVRLTPAGTRLALKVVRHHRLLE